MYFSEITIPLETKWIDFSQGNLTKGSTKSDLSWLRPDPRCVCVRENRKTEMIRNSSFSFLPPALIGILLKVNHLFDCPHLSFPCANFKWEASS